jgi:hypothetical protein
VKIMASRILPVCAGLMLTLMGAYSHMAFGAVENMLAQAQSDSGYRVGDTLAPAKPRAASGDYDDILWETLRGEGWNPEQQMESLNLNELADNDPRAREILQKIREMWDNAPVNPKLDNRRVRIPGFAVPLDGEKDKAREFLLVPYFGACIHAPAPPANQVIHVVVDKAVKTVKLSPALWISGTMRTVRSDTRMGASGYEMTVDKVEPYKLEYSPF